jgi:hypothetical protein
MVATFTPSAYLPLATKERGTNGGNAFEEAFIAEDKSSSKTIMLPRCNETNVCKKVRFQTNESGHVRCRVYWYPSAINVSDKDKVYWNNEDLSAIRQECKMLVKMTSTEHRYYVECIEMIYKAAQDLIIIDSDFIQMIAMFPTRGLEYHTSSLIQTRQREIRLNVLRQYRYLIDHTDLPDDEIKDRLCRFSQAETRGSRFYAFKMGNADHREADVIYCPAKNNE